MQTNNYGCWIKTVECEMIILSTAATTVSFSTPGTRPRRGLWKKSMSRWQHVFWQVFFTIMMSSCENVIRVSTYDIHFEFQRWHWKWEKKVLDCFQMKISCSSESPTQDHLLHLILLWNWGSCLLKVLISAVKREGGFFSVLCFFP